MPDNDIVDVSEMMQSIPIIFHGKTFVTREVMDKIIKPTTNIHALLDSPEQRLEGLFKERPGLAIDIHTRHPANQTMYSNYCLHALDGDTLFEIKKTIDYREGNGKIVIEMNDNARVH